MWQRFWKFLLFNYEIVTCREGHNRYSRIEKYSGPNELYAQGEECQKTIGWLQLQLKYICKFFQWILCEISQYSQYIQSPNYSLVKHHAKGGAPQQVGRLTYPCCAIFYRPHIFFFFFLKSDLRLCLQPFEHNWWTFCHCLSWETPNRLLLSSLYSEYKFQWIDWWVRV